MPGRGNGRGRGGRNVNFKPSPRNESSVHDRLGKMAVYPKNNDRTKRFKFVRPSAITASVAQMPTEQRIRSLSKRFMRAYYEIFDQPGRANLESQYSSDAFFSFSATYPMPTFGRNLLEVREPENRIRLLIHGRTNIALALNTFPPTEHLVNQLSCDVPFYIVNTMSVISMQIVVNGVFKDTSETTNPLKAFTRVFIIKQMSVDKQGEPVYEIFNDLFMLQPPTPDQIKRYHHEAQIIKRDRPSVSSAANRPAEDRLVKSQDAILQTVMMKTRMNELNSRKLLGENNWDEAKSIEMFNELYAANKIPQNFFAP